MQKYLEKGNWNKIEKLYLYADSGIRLALAQACGKVKTDVSGNVLGVLIRDPEEKSAASRRKQPGENRL